MKKRESLFIKLKTKNQLNDLKIHLIIGIVVILIILILGIVSINNSFQDMINICISSSNLDTQLYQSNVPISGINPFDSNRPPINYRPPYDPYLEPKDPPNSAYTPDPTDIPLYSCEGDYLRMTGSIIQGEKDRSTILPYYILCPFCTKCTTSSLFWDNKEYKTATCALDYQNPVCRIMTMI